MTQEDKVEFLLQQGHEELDRGQYSAALATFQQAVAREPDNPQVLYGLGLACYWLERYRESVRYLTEALQVKPSYILALVRRGLAYQELKENEQAGADFELAISIEPQDHEDWRGRGIALKELERYEEAIASFCKAIEIKPDSHDAWYNKGIMLKKLGRNEEAITSYENAIKIKHDYQYVWYENGILLYDLGRYEEAIASYDKAIEIKPDSHKAWNNRGNALSKLGRDEEAITSFNRAIEIKYDSHKIWYNRGNVLSKLGRDEEAIASFDKAIEIKPDLHEAWNGRGSVLNNLGQNEEAITSFNKAIEINSDYHLAWGYRGIALDGLGRYEEAIASYDKVIEIKPNDHLAWGHRGVALKNLRRYEEAIASYDEALRLTDNQFWEAWANRGSTVFLYLLDYEAAIQNWNDGIIALQPQTPDYQQGVGELHRKKAFYQYEYGKIQPSKRFPSWFEAKQSYEAALKFLTFEDFPLPHLEVLLEYLEVCNALGDRKTIQERLEKGTQQLEELLRQCEVLGQKISLSHKFAAFDQLRVDAKAESKDKQQQIQALELAERRKNTCLSWYQYGWERAVPETTYQEMQQLLDNKTAIIYWHLSPAAITTFILGHEKPPIVHTLKPRSSPQKSFFFGLFSRKATSAETAHLKAVQQLEAFEEWMKTWQRDYQNYREAKEKDTHPWRVQMPARLRQLAEILEIDAILPHLQGIERLILIPHRQLHLLPLHYLFNIVAQQQFAISYLPSARIGIDRQRQVNSPANYLLNVEQAEDRPFVMALSAVISQLFPYCQNLREPDLTPAQLMAALSTSKGIFHFGGHGKHNIDQPLNSALILTNEQELTLGDIFKIELGNYYLACLCACETGITSQQNLIDEYVGLVSAFVRMGVTYVLSTLWRVPEEATSLLLMEFYRLFQQGVAPVLALQQAQAWLRSVTYHDLVQYYQDRARELSGDRAKTMYYISLNTKRSAKRHGSELPYSHPYFWAAFILTGMGS